MLVCHTWCYLFWNERRLNGIIDGVLNELCDGMCVECDKCFINRGKLTDINSPLLVNGKGEDCVYNPGPIERSNVLPLYAALLRLTKLPLMQYFYFYNNKEKL